MKIGDVLVQVVLPILLSNIFALYIFVLKDKSDRPSKKASAQETLQHTVEGLAKQNQGFVVELSQARREISQLRSGMIIVIGQLEAAGIEPAWKPDWMNGKDKDGKVA